MQEKVREWLLSEAETGYRAFSASLIPECDNLLGVRLPKLRKKAKELVKGDWQTFVSADNCIYMEELLLQGMVIGLLDLPLEKHLKLVKAYVHKITNWSLCDSFCCGLKFTSRYSKEVWKFLKSYLKSKKEFELRFGVVMLLNYYVTDEWINEVLEVLFSLNSDDYYAQMGIAWAISICMVKYFDKTYEKISTCSLPKVIFKKSIQKSCESYRLTTEQKNLLKALY